MLSETLGFSPAASGEAIKFTEWSAGEYNCLKDFLVKKPSYPTLSISDTDLE